MDASTAAFRPDSPRRLKRTHTGISLKIPIACTPACTPQVTCHEPSFFSRSRRPRFRDFGDERPPPLASWLSVPSATLAHQTPRHSRPGPREGAAHARASAFGRREREGLAEAVKGRVCGGTRPSADEIRREPRASWRRFRRVSGRRPGGVCAYLDRGGSTPTTDLARWRRASPTPRPLSGSRA